MAMASRATSFVKSISALINRAGFTTLTSPKMKAYAPNKDLATTPMPLKGEYVPVCISLGLIVLSVSIGTATAVHHLKRNPSVCVKKSTREKVSELVEPEKVAEETDRFLKKSFFRKVAHVQDFDRRDVYAVPEPRVEAPKTVASSVARG